MAERLARKEEQRRYSAAELVRNDAQEQSKAQTTDAAGNRLPVAAGELAARSGNTGDPGTTRRSYAATSAAMVLSDLVQRADKRAEEQAKAYDVARIIGSASEAWYGMIICGL